MCETNPSRVKMRISDIFCADDAEITFQSADLVGFRVHNINLKANTEGFSPPEQSTLGELVQVTEHSAVLELLFQFIYSMPQPDIQSMDFTTVALLAEAAEKYQVYPAMSRCSQYMSDILPNHPVSVFAYASKHDYPDIMSKAALLILDTPLPDIVATIPADMILPWLRYHERWTEVARNAVTQPAPLPPDKALTVIQRIVKSLRSLQDLDSTFKAETPKLGSLFTHSLDYGSLFKQWRESVEVEINKIPSFANFLSNRQEGSTCQQGEAKPPLHVKPLQPKFTADDGDVVIKSSDGVVFRIHAAYFEACAASSPSWVKNVSTSQTSSQHSIQSVPESSSTLNLLFHYIYPMRKPDLSSFDFSAVESLAAAAEKYCIYSAMAECNVYITKALPEHADVILAYAAKHSYFDLADRAAPLVVDQPLQNISRLLPTEAIVPWIEYVDKWNQVTRTARKSYLDLKTGSNTYNNSTYRLCASCCRALEKEIIQVLWTLGEGAPSLAKVDALIDPSSVCCDARRHLLQQWREGILKDLAGIPCFSTFL